MSSEEQRGAGLNLQFDAGAKALVATVEPVAESVPVDESWLKARIAELGYAHLRYLPAAALILLGKYNAGAPVAALRLAECVDASFSITVDADGLSAALHIVPAQGGDPVGEDAVLAEIAVKGISVGVDGAAIRQAVAADAANGLVIARGQPPVHGEDGSFESLLPDARDRAPKVSESGLIDYRDLGDILVVHPGDALMLRHPATDGCPGQTVLGVAIPARPGKEVMFSAKLSGVAIDPGNPNRLLAAIAGQPVLVAGGMIVEPVYSVGDVGTASGNINFDGSVVIAGDVASGMTVVATGDIEISGMVEAATLQAGGSIVVKGGVVGSLGRKEGGEHSVRCGGSFSAAFTQQAKVEAGDSIFIDDTAMQSELIAANYVVVGNKRRGNIIGGRVQATLSVTAKVLGSPNRVKTIIEIGVNPAMQKVLLEMAKNRDAKETQMLEVSKLLDFARLNPDRIRPEMIDKARATAAVLSGEIATLRTEHEALTQKIKLSLESQAIAQQAMYEGVEVYMGTQRYRVAGERGPGAIGLGKGGLTLVESDRK